MLGTIPVLSVTGRSLAQAWEASLIKLHKNGTQVRTQYDAKDAAGEFIDPPSIDASMLITVLEPLSEPMIHLAFPGGPADLEEYRQEVIDGIKDHWVRNPEDPNDHRWDYTYHGRLTKYRYPFTPAIDQMRTIVDQLVACPYTRRAKAITWQPWQDTDCSDPPCLCEEWYRILEDEDGTWRLNMNVVFRSRDAYDAAFMNMFAFIWKMRDVADKVQQRVGCEVKLGRYTDFSHSYHIYGKRLHGAPPNFMDGFTNTLTSRTFEERTARYEDWEPLFEEARPAIAKKVESYEG